MLIPKDFKTTPNGKWRFRNEFSGRVSGPFYTPEQLLKDVRLHRNGNGISTPLGWEWGFWDEACRQNGWDCKDDQVVHEDDVVTKVGRALWVELHEYAAAYPAAPTDERKKFAAQWIQDWINRIPRFSKCNCRADFEKWHAVWPVQLDSGAAFVEWAEVLHDRVNKKLGRPLKNEANKRHTLFSV